MTEENSTLRRLNSTRRSIELLAGARYACAITSRSNRSECVYGLCPVRCHDIRHSRMEKRPDTVTVRISLAVAVDKARVMEKLGWQVHVTDSSDGYTHGVRWYYAHMDPRN